MSDFSFGSENFAYEQIDKHCAEQDVESNVRSNATPKSDA